MSFSTITWNTLVKKDNPDFFKKDVIYRFGGGREFLSTDAGQSGVYKLSAPTPILDEGGNYILDEGGNIIYEG